ncbi:MAG: glycosyltransferase [Geobacteraceae bacterium]
MQKSTMQVTHSLSVVTVTYGDRWHLLEKVLLECRSQGVKEVVVVDNAATLPMDHLTQAFGQFVKVLHVPHNSGSAAGFKMGLKYALDAGAEYILMLDDDNVPAPGSIALLSQALAESLRQHPSGHVAVLGNRSHPDAPQNLAEKSVQLRPGCFLGFHFSDMPAKIMRRLGKKQQKHNLPDSPGTIETGVSTYGGLMFHRNLIDKIGFPREDFILYMDDYEWTYRITSQGGIILLIADAHVIDLEMQWNFGSGFKNSFEVWLLGKGDARAFYTARNRVYFEALLQPHNTAVYLLNRFLFLTLLCFYAWKTGQKMRHGLLLEAIADGENGRLGTAPGFPLN